MTFSEPLKQFIEGRGYTRDEWEENNHSEWTKEELIAAKPLSDMPIWLKIAVNSEVKRKRGERGKQKTPTKVYINIGLDRDILEKFKATGAGWQSRINEALKNAQPA